MRQSTKDYATHRVCLLEVEDTDDTYQQCSRVKQCHRLLTDRVHKPVPWLSAQSGQDEEPGTHVAKIAVENLHISMHYLQRDQLVVSRPNSAYEEEGGVTSVNHLGIYVVQ